MTIDDDFDNSDNCFCLFDNWKDNPGDLWHLRHWIQFWQLRTWIHDNICYLTINCDTGQHSQFLRCFYIFIGMILAPREKSSPSWDVIIPWIGYPLKRSPTFRFSIVRIVISVSNVTSLQDCLFNCQNGKTIVWIVKRVVNCPKLSKW